MESKLNQKEKSIWETLPENRFSTAPTHARFTRMCGKFRYFASWAEVHEFSEPLIARASNLPEAVATPMATAPVLHLAADGQRQASRMRWGFTQEHQGRHFPKHIHARNDRLQDSPLWRPHFEARRGLLIVTSFNEGEEVATYKPDRVTPTGNTRTRQWTIRPKDGARLAIAILYRQTEQNELEFVMCTTKANHGISQFVTGDPDKRMAAVLHPQDLPAWLGETSTPLPEIQALLRPYEDEGAWDMAPEDAAKNQTPPAPAQGNLF